MARRSTLPDAVPLFAASDRPSRPTRPFLPLVIQEYLAQESKAKLQHFATDLERAAPLLRKWADFEIQGTLQRKETSLDAEFLNEIFGDALGHTSFSESTPDYTLERQLHVPGVGSADGALGKFSQGNPPKPAAIIELKAANVDLDRDRFNGRTPIQQCWDYLNALPGCIWGIVSNIVSIRLYHRLQGSRCYHEFRLQDLRRPERLQEFCYLFARGGIISTKLDPTPRAVQLLKRSGERQRTVGDNLYEAYRAHRLELIDHLHNHIGYSVDKAITVAQRLLDRIVFIAFCEDRGLLPNGIIERVYREVPPLARATNPRWQNFLDLFQGVDSGHENLRIEKGYNGRLFKHDPDVDNLQLDDDWTSFFKEVSTYDFRDTVHVEVLGHLFEKSITELEKLRATGFFESGGTHTKKAEMPKSAQRKRFGIYYTPPEFTSLIVDRTIGDVVRARFAECKKPNGLDPQATPYETSPAHLTYWSDCLAILRNLKICDPACGSGAFLIRTYDYLFELYDEVIHNLALNEHPDATELAENIPDMILAENLYGVDLSFEAVEITQLALWIRSARRGKTLNDLSKNVIHGNSLVDDSQIDPQSLQWQSRFPEVFDRDESGFDCVIGNPPWERLKLQEREFFSFSASEIASAVSAATRRSKIAALEKKNPELFKRYQQAKQHAERILAYVRNSDRFPLTARGDINTYPLFAELGRDIVAPNGRVGLLVPSGIATDKTTMQFFNDLMTNHALIALYDFENRKGFFPDVHRSFKFSALITGGGNTHNESADFVFFAHTLQELDDTRRHIPLSAQDMALVNPNTKTCPIFRSRRVAEITKSIYQRVPVLLDRTRKKGGNPWGIKFLRMFDQTNDAELFHTAEKLAEMGYKLDGNRWRKHKHVFLPLYEAKMVQAYDHRAASVRIDEKNWMRQGQPESSSLVQHQNPEFLAQPRWWIEEKVVSDSLGESRERGFIGFKDITSPTNQRTMIAAAIPWSGVTNHFPLLITRVAPRLELCLLANLNAIPFDYVARQKIGGVTLNFFIVEQLPVFPPDRYNDKCPWNPKQTLQTWISDRAIKLTCTADDMHPLADAVGFKKRLHKWNPVERAKLLAELDAAYFHLYGLSRDDADYVLSTFAGTSSRDPSLFGHHTIAEFTLQAYDALHSRAGARTCRI